jgi:hypothetical protein
LNSSMSFKANASSSWVHTPFLISMILVVHWSFRFLLPISEEQGDVDIWTSKIEKWRPRSKICNLTFAFSKIAPGMVRKMARAGYHYLSKLGFDRLPSNKL